jgi:hypothetical protein
MAHTNRHRWMLFSLLFLLPIAFVAAYWGGWMFNEWRRTESLPPQQAIVPRSVPLAQMVPGIMIRTLRKRGGSIERGMKADQLERKERLDAFRKNGFPSGPVGGP